MLTRLKGGNGPSAFHFAPFGSLYLNFLSNRQCSSSHSTKNVYPLLLECFGKQRWFTPVVGAIMESAFGGVLDRFFLSFFLFITVTFCKIVAGDCYCNLANQKLLMGTLKSASPQGYRSIDAGGLILKVLTHWLPFILSKSGHFREVR